MAKPGYDMTTIGESMLRYSVPSGTRLARAATLEVHSGGAESNVAIALATLGHRVAWLSRLPDSPLGRRVAREIDGEGVDTSGVSWVPEGRVGLYYVEFASPPRPIQVLYDRAGSSAAGMGPADVAWERLLDTRLIHLTGITPALSDGCRALVEQVLERARERAIPVVFDVNYRARLWEPSRAAATLLPMMQQASLLICNRADASTLFGIEGTADEVLDGLVERSGCAQVVVTLGEAGALARDARGKRYHQAAIPVEPIVDRLGAGDAFAGGVIAGLLEGSLEEGLRYGAALSAIKLGIHGDAVRSTREEVLALVRRAPGPLRPAR